MVTMVSEAPQTKGQLRNTVMANRQSLGILSILSKLRGHGIMEYADRFVLGVLDKKKYCRKEHKEFNGECQEKNCVVIQPSAWTLCSAEGPWRVPFQKISPFMNREGFL